MGEAPHPQPLDLSAEADEIVEAWLDDLPNSTRVRSDDLVRSYRSLAGSVLRRGLGPDTEDDDPTDDEFTDLHRELDGVAAATRKAGLSISSLLDDFGRLTPATLAWLSGRFEIEGDAATVLRITTRIALALESVARRLVRVLEESAARAHRERVEALHDMTDMLSHELRNRLGAARTASQMLLSPSIELDDSAVTRAAKLVLMSVDAGLATVDDVRALAARRSDSGEPSTNDVRLPNLIGAIVERLDPQARAVGVDLRVDGDIVDCLVDGSRLRLVIFNLTWNGIKYRDDQEAEPSVSIATSQDDDGSIELTIRDNGVGIAEDEIGDIFRYRVRGRHGDSVPGSGLGLAIVREAVDQIGGRITVESERGVGTSFVLRFEPLAPES